MQDQDRRQLEIVISVALKVAPKHVRSGLLAKLPHQIDDAATELAGRVAEAIRKMFEVQKKDWNPAPGLHSRTQTEVESKS